MKQLLLILFAVFAQSFAAAAQETIDLQINNVKVVTTETEVIQKFGKPLSSRKKAGDECQGDLQVLRYPGMTLELEAGKPKEKIVIAAVSVTSPKWSVSNINIGASLSEVQKKFGSSQSEMKKGLDYRSYIIGDGYADFVFQKDILVKIYWKFNFC